MVQAFRVAYDGRDFRGSAIQPDVRTVEGEMREALVSMGALDGKRRGDMRMASRTDAGVSSLGNVVIVDSEMSPEKIIRAMNGSHRRSGLWFLGWADLPAGLDPRHVRKRWYRYLLPLGPAEAPGNSAPDVPLPVGSALDMEVMDRVARAFEGDHDFISFSKTDRSDPGKNTVRTVREVRIATIDLVFSMDMRRATVSGPEPGTITSSVHRALIIDVVGVSFLWQMVRRMASALVMAGRGDVDPGDIEAMLEGGDGPGVAPLPAENLVLMDVDYGDRVTFRSVEGMELAGAVYEARVSPLLVDLAFHSRLMDILR